ncbi:MAG: hypothetical protein L0206_16790 [Actinobacteria bacterium]|nr:hypothetical protein [Actinomycetota bacterium]
MTATYQLFEALDPATEAALRASIERWGVLVPIVLDQHGNVIDGHQRRRIAGDLGVECPDLVRHVADEAEALDLAETLNADRRHLLDPGRRREVVADLRAQGHSLRAIAGALGVSQPTVHRDVERSGDSPVSPDVVRGLDGKRYPATRSAPAPDGDEGEPLFGPGEEEAILDTLREEHGDDLTADQIERAVDENAESKRLPEARPEPYALAKPDLGDGVSHPARFSDELMPVFRQILLEHTFEGARVLDPFAGTGKIHELRPEFETVGIELESEWADLHEHTRQGSALELPFDPDTFDAIVTSPTYGNRLADSHNASDPERRRSYTHDLGRPLSPDNSGALHWRNGAGGSAAYREFHERAWDEAVLVLRPGGLFVLNMCDHVRGGLVMPVTAWHTWHLGRIGLEYVDSITVPTRKLRQGENGELREQEYVHVFRLAS